MSTGAKNIPHENFFLGKNIFPLHLLFLKIFCIKITLIHVPSNKEDVRIHQDLSTDNS